MPPLARIELIMLVFGMATLVLWLYALIDTLRSDFNTGTEKLIWLLVVLFLSFLGSLMYLTIGRKKRIV